MARRLAVCFRVVKAAALGEQAGMRSHTARLQRACACDLSCAVAQLWALPSSCAGAQDRLNCSLRCSKKAVFYFPLLLSPCWPVGGIFQVERNDVSFLQALCDAGTIMDHRRKPRKSSEGSKGWVSTVNLIRKTTGQSDP